MLFSATFKKKIERLARDVLTGKLRQKYLPNLKLRITLNIFFHLRFIDPVKIVQGSIGEASEDVHQVVKVMGAGGFKWQWLISKLVEFTSVGSVLIFVTKKANSEELAKNLKLKDFDVRIIHGDLFQHERNEIITAFRK